ncbi:glutamine amidotransferase [Corynebacterium senegalense]|uniref:glutamine amidotransferase n=1 Tax=Corynebacterium senegalense TaxID=2080750 RepID=UPI000E202C10|nr:glutamine amidotransferase [Corynebacterium senegalense]
MSTYTRPFLLLSTRPEDEAAAAELASFLSAMGLPAGAIEQRRLERAPLGRVDLDAYSGVLLGGSPFNNTDASKSRLQLRVEREIGTLVAAIIDRDLPLLGACYGIGAIGTAIGARLSSRYAEDAASIELSLNDAGAADPILAGLPARFSTIVGHKEAVEHLPDAATVLVTGEACPTQMFRVRSNVYATQFHPELTAESLELRLRIYADQGYYDADELESILETAYAADYSWNRRILENFAARYAR